MFKEGRNKAWFDENVNSKVGNRKKKNRLLKDKWCEQVPLLHKFLKVYVNLDKKIQTVDEASS